MRSSRFDLGGLLADIQATQAARAADLGYPSVESMLAAEESAERDREVTRRETMHRRSVVDALGARLTDATAHALATGTEGTTEAVRVVREWAASSKPTLVLSGGVGTGKTVAALSYVCTRIEPWQFVRAARLGAMFERWESDREDRIEALRLSVPTMVIDDLGQEPIEDRRTIPALHEVLDSRKSSRTRTIITTNLTAEQAKARYPGPDISRLAESALWVSLRGEDMRRRR